MSPRRHLLLAAFALLATPLIACAQATGRVAVPRDIVPQSVQWVEPGPRVPPQALYRQGWEQGRRAGLEDARQGQAYRFTDESDFRRTDAVLGQRGYSGRYRDEYRRGYQEGYSSGWSAVRQSARPGGPVWSGRGNALPPGWSNGRGGARGSARFDYAFQNGVSDGYEAGMEDARDRDRFDPVSEGRYRDGDHGYEREYGPKDLYKANYRVGFRQGYEEGYRDAQRYGWQ